MACFASGSKTQLSYVAEATYGTTPGTPQMQVVPFISNGLNVTKSIFEDPSIRSDRQPRFRRHGNKIVEGDVSVAYAHETYDSLLESLLYNTWSTNVLTIGSTQKSFTIETGHTDIDQWRVFTGVVVDTFSLEVNLDGVVTSTFTLIGKDGTISTTELDATPTAAPDKQPFTHLSGTFTEGGSVIATLTGITLEVSNNTARNYVLGSNSVYCVSPGTYSVSGTATAWFADATLYNKFLNETSTGIEFTLSDGTNTHKWELDTIKYDSADIVVNGDETIPITLNFFALYNSGNSSIIKITRSA